MRLRRLLLILLCFVSVSAFSQGKKADTEALGRALEYFQSQKYHEALLIFQRLDQSYKLNARYKAYIGLCYYYDWDYKKATEYFDTFLPKLSMLAPRGAGALLLCGRGKPLPVGPLRPGDPPLPVCAHTLPRPGQGRQLVSDRLLLLLSPAAGLGPGLLPHSRILLRHVSQLSRPASATSADDTHDARLAARDRPQGPATDFLPTPPRAAYCLPQDRGRHIIYRCYHQASSSTNGTTTSRSRGTNATSRAAKGG